MKHLSIAYLSSTVKSCALKSCVLVFSTLVSSAFIFAGCTQAQETQSSGKANAGPISQAIENPLGVNIGHTQAKSKGMVASAHPLATQAGVEILKQGGSAIDAAIAVQAMLGLTEPQSSGLGGGAFLVVYDPRTAKVWVYNGRETAPQAADETLFLDPESGEPLRFFDGLASGLSTGVPGAVVMLHMAHEDYGKLPWGSQLNTAIKTAEDGFAISPRLAFMIDRMGKFALKNQKAARDYFFIENGTQPLPEGFIRDNAAYAETLRAIQKNPRALLEGPIAQAIIDATQEGPRPGKLTLADMAQYQPQKTPALCSAYRGHTVCGAQPPSSGGVAVQSILRTLENFDMKALGPSAQGWHVFSEASFLAYADRDKFIADPDFVPVETEKMLNAEYLQSRAALISMDKAMDNVTAGDPFSSNDFGQDATPDNPGTSHFTVVDEDGLVVSMTTTVEAPFGSQRMAAGFILNNQLTDFSFRALDDHGAPIANAPAGGKRPRSSMSPSIVFNPDGEFLFTTGSPGGNSIIAYTVKTIVGILDWGLSPLEAAGLPNVIARNGSIKMEAKGIIDEQTQEVDRGSPAENFGMSPDIVSALEAKGHKIVRSRGEFSGLHLIYRNQDGSLIGAADPRREGTAQGVE